MHIFLSSQHTTSRAIEAPRWWVVLLFTRSAAPIDSGALGEWADKAGGGGASGEGKERQQATRARAQSDREDFSHHDR